MIRFKFQRPRDLDAPASTRHLRDLLDAGMREYVKAENQPSGRSAESAMSRLAAVQFWDGYTDGLAAAVAARAGTDPLHEILRSAHRIGLDPAELKMRARR